jgi:hypothetical protein
VREHKKSEGGQANLFSALWQWREKQAGGKKIEKKKTTIKVCLSSPFAAIQMQTFFLSPGNNVISLINFLKHKKKESRKNI